MAVGICVGVALTSILAPIGASANPLEEVAAGPKAAVEEVVNTVSGVTNSVVPPVPPPPVSPPASTPQLPVKTPPVSLPPAPEAIPPPPPKPPPAVKAPLPSAPKAQEDSAAHAPHGSGPNLGSFGSSSGGKNASPEAASNAAATTPGPAITEKSGEPPAASGRGVSASRPPTVSPGIALPHWFIRVWPAVNLGHIGRALVGRAFYALGLGSLTAPRLIVGLLPAISGFTPAIGPSHFAVLGAADASKDDEPSGGPSVAPIHSNPETVAFVILACLTALAVLAFGSELPVFRRHRRW